MSASDSARALVSAAVVGIGTIIVFSTVRGAGALAGKGEVKLGELAGVSEGAGTAGAAGAAGAAGGVEVTEVTEVTEVVFVAGAGVSGLSAQAANPAKLCKASVVDVRAAKMLRRLLTRFSVVVFVKERGPISVIYSCYCLSCFDSKSSAPIDPPRRSHLIPFAVSL